MTDTDLLLTFNAGSSTVKIGLFEINENRPRPIGKSLIDLRRRPFTFHLTEGPAVFDVPLDAEATEDLHDVIAETFAILAMHFNMDADHRQ